MWFPSGFSFTEKLTVHDFLAASLAQRDVSEHSFFFFFLNLCYYVTIWHLYHLAISKMTQQIKALTAKPGSLSSILGICVVEGEN